MLPYAIDQSVKSQYCMAIQMKWICSNDFDLKRKLLDLEAWLTGKGHDQKFKK